jgi:anaerobic selenocysteine-containing dehydrogenase
VTEQSIKTYCALCISRCGAIARVRDGRFLALDPDPSHPTGQALCAKGRAAPELVYSKDRLLHPMKRTNPKGAADPGWQRIGWEEALDLVAEGMCGVAARHGPQAFAFSNASSSTTAAADHGPFLRRLTNAFGTPNQLSLWEMCGWGRAFATRFTFGVDLCGVVPGGAMPDIARAGCLVLWGYNPSASRLVHATQAVEAMKRGMRLVFVDPRRVGLASKADQWLRVRPGSDGALALGLANVMIARRWYDRAFIAEWSNGPLLVRVDGGRLLTGRDLEPDGSEQRYYAWDSAAGAPVAYDCATGRYERAGSALALEGEFEVATPSGRVTCRPVFALYAELCRRYSPEAIESTCWIPRAQLEATARLLWEARPVAYYAWSGHEQHANATQTARALSLLYALTGSFDVAGGNVIFPFVRSGAVAGEEFPSVGKMAKTIGLAERPLGPATARSVNTLDFYRAVVEGEPYPVRGLMGFGANSLVSLIDPGRARQALTALEFHVHVDMFVNPTAQYADVVLPAASPFEREAVRFGFDVNEKAQELVQLRQPIVAPQGESRSDTAIIFALAARLGFGAQFWNGDIDAALRAQLAPSGLSLESLRASPAGIRVPLETRFAKHTTANADGVPRGFATPSRKVELWSETLRRHGYAALPEFEEPEQSPLTRPALAQRYSLVLTCAKNTLFCNSQHRGLPSLRRRQVEPEIELHPDAALKRGIADGAWVTVETPEGSIRVVARFNASLDPRVAVGQHGWWQACADANAPGYDTLGSNSPNFNLLIGDRQLDPVSGTPAVRSSLCEIRACT